MAKTSKRVRQAAPDREERRKRIEIIGVAATVGLPAAQRDVDRLAIAMVEQVGRGPRVAEKTVRKLSRIEALARAGVLEPHEAAACEWFGDVAQLAWDTVRCTANCDIAGGGGSGTAPDRLAAKSIEIANARDDYAYAIAAIPLAYRPMFLAITCENETVGTVGARLYADLKRSQREHKVRVAFKLCANLLHGQIGNRLSIE